MAEITRQHLELAALAAGLPDHDWIYANDSMICIDLDGDQDGDPWRPHLDDGDNRRLQVSLGMTLACALDRRLCEAFIPSPAAVTSGAIYHDGSPSDAARAAREAVVLCAAAVGERMRSER